MFHIFICASGSEIRPGATGKAVRGYQARVTDERGAELPAGQVCRLAVRGPTGCRYLDDPALQKEYVKDGWNYTGDAYGVDEEGYFFFQARTDDMIVTAGCNISGPEVEEALLAHEAVVDCACVASPDPERGNSVKAFVVLKPEVSDPSSMTTALQDFVKAQIAPYKYPREVEFVERLPRIETGRSRGSSCARWRRKGSSPHENPEPEGLAPGQRLLPWNRGRGETRIRVGTGGLGRGHEVASRDFAAQLRQALLNTRAILAEAGCGPEQVVRMTWYVVTRRSISTLSLTSAPPTATSWGNTSPRWRWSS